MPKVLISDKLSESAVNVFKENQIETEYMPGLNPDELLKLIDKFDGLAVRSATKVNEEVFKNAKNLKILFSKFLKIWFFLILYFFFKSCLTTLCSTVANFGTHPLGGIWWHLKNITVICHFFFEWLDS